MIDIKNVEKEFDNYVKNFDSNNSKIKLKIEHIKRVSQISKLIAVDLGLDEEHIRLAQAIGFFHDIGRFKQIEIFNTYNDKISVNHAELGIKILFEDNLIDNFKIDDKYKKIIKLAVLNHNKNKIEDGLTDEELLFSKIIRDADKLDIFYTDCNYDFDSIFWYKNFEGEKINDILMKQFLDLHSVDYSYIKTNFDVLITFYAYIYDLYFDFSINYLQSNNYLEIFTNRIIQNFSNGTLENQLNEILKICNNYLKNRRK